MSVINETSLVERLAARFGDMLTVKVDRNEVTAEVAPRDLIAVATALRDEAGFRFTIPDRRLWRRLPQLRADRVGHRHGAGRELLARRGR
ncbi:MAG: hypothetical protein PW786_08845 [Arachidicoccus sp.]|nr:hypothetical protein [Arachidicoccus sp.]